MGIIKEKIKSDYLFLIKKIVDLDNDGDRFTIVRRNKNIAFMRKYELSDEDVKNIIKKLSIDDCYAGPEQDYNSDYDGWIFKFNPSFKFHIDDKVKLYIKLRVENKERTVCISVHEFGKYDEEIDDEK